MTPNMLVKYLQWDIDAWWEGLEHTIHNADLVAGAKAY